MTYTISREWLRVTGSAFFLCCGHTVSSSSSRLVNDIFPGYAIDQSYVDVEEVDPNFVMATLILFLETQRAVRDGEGRLHAHGLAIRFRNLAVSRIHTLQTIHLARKIFVYLKCYHDSSRTPQHSGWNCVGANRPQHMHMYGLIVCD